MNTLQLLDQAEARITLIDIGARLGVKVVSGVQRSPFREDTKPSFSIFRGDRLFKDWGTGMVGGARQFIRHARPGWSDKQITAFILDAAGLARPAPDAVDVKKNRTTLIATRSRPPRKRPVGRYTSEGPRR